MFNYSNFLKLKNKKSNKEIMLLGNLFWKIFNTSENAILILNNQKIIECNNKALEIFKAKSEDLLNKEPFTLSPEFQPDGINSIEKGQSILKNIFNESFANFEWLHKKVNGELFHSNISVHSFKQNGNHYMAATIIDTTLARKEQEELQNYRKRIEELVKEKTLIFEEANCELQATNERLDATNEELSSSNNELLSTNELLHEEIAHHKKTQALKAILEEKFNQFISQSNDAIAIINANGIVEEWNEAMAELTGLKKEEAINQFLWDIEFEIFLGNNDIIKTQEQTKKDILSSLKNIREIHGTNSEKTFQHKLQGQKIIQNTVFPIIGSSNYVGIISRDITYKKHIEAKLNNYKIELETLLSNNSEKLLLLSERLNEVYKNTTEAIVFFDISKNGNALNVFDANDTAKKYLQKNSVQFREGIGLSEMIEKEEYDQFVRNYLPQILKGETVSFEKTEIINNRKSFWQTTLIPIKNSIGEIYRFASFSKDTTEKRENQENISILNAAIESWPYDLWVFDKNGVIVIQNKTSIDNWGDNFGKHYKDIKFPKENRETIIGYFNEISNGVSIRNEITLNIKNKIKHLLLIFSPITLPNGSFNGFLNIVIDITEKKEIEEIISLSEKKFNSIFQENPVPLSLSDFETGCFIDVNEAFLKLIHANSFNEIIGHTSIELGIFSLEERKKVLSIIEKKGQIKNYEVSLKRLDGKPILVEWSAIIYELEGKKYLLTTHTDITLKRKSELFLKESEAKYRIAFHTNPDSVTLTKLDGTYVDINKGFTRLTGYTRNEVIGVAAINLDIWAKPKDRQLLIKSLKAHTRTENLEFEFKLKNGSIITGLMSASLIKINGELHILSITKNISERKKMQTALTANENKFRTIFNSSKDGIAILDRNMNLIDVNSSVLTKTIFTYEELIGKSILEFLVVEDTKDVISQINKIWNGESITNFEVEIKVNKNDKIPAEISASLIHLENKDAILVMVRDITERRKHEKELLDSVINTEEKERLYFSQELHDGLGPLVSAAKMYIQWLAKPSANIEKKEILSDVEKLLDEATLTIRDMSFKISPHILKNFGLVEATKAFADKVKELNTINIEIIAIEDFKLKENEETILYRLLCECINNTLKHAKASKITIEFAIENNLFTIIYFDNGQGFDLEQTLAKRKGVGLLNMQSRIKSINGQFNIYSSPEKGVKIIVNISSNVKIL